jgi:hypothetical protein
MDWLSDMFVLALPVVEKVLRPIIDYGFLILGLRLAGNASWPSLTPSTWSSC